MKHVYDQVYAACLEKRKDKTVSMEHDGWSNVHNDPLICCSVTTAKGDSFLSSTIDTEDERDTADNLEKMQMKPSRMQRDANAIQHQQE